MRVVRTRPTVEESACNAEDGRATLPEYLTAAQVGAMLQLSAKTVFRLARQDATLPQLRVAGSVRFPRERLLRWLRAREGAPVK